MNAEQRHGFIIDYMLKNGPVTVKELSARLAVSPVTIRRDLDELQKQRLIERSHGGARVNEERFDEFSYDRKSYIDVAEKKEIARETLKLLDNDDVVFFDKGTTVAEVAKALDDDKFLTVVTNSLVVANLVKNKRNIQLIIIGGVYERALEGTSGSLGVQALQQLRFDKCIIGISGVSVEHGLTTRDSTEVELKQTAIAVSKQIILPVSNAKIGTVRMMCVAPITAVDTLVTSGNLDTEVAGDLHTAGVEVILCPKAQELPTAK